MRQLKDCRPLPKIEWLRLTVLSIAAFVLPFSAHGQNLEVRNAAGLRMTVDTEDHNPALHVIVPGGPENQRSFNILLPEHFTVRAHGQSDVKHPYMFRPGPQGDKPQWKRAGNALEYASDFGQIHFLARATLMDDGILFRYEFVNHSARDYDMATAITDPRFHTFFYDPRLERTYVHYKNGFALLASDTPERLTMPLKDWFPVRYLASYTAPIPAERVQRPGDGITYRYSSRAVDIPMIATLSVNHRWVAASFARDPGNVWSNPELTCQHVDPQVPLLHGARAFYEMKILIFKGSLDDALHKVLAQRGTLRQSASGPMQR
jgi:hypothetical protein